MHGERDNSYVVFFRASNFLYDSTLFVASYKSRPTMCANDGFILDPLILGLAIVVTRLMDIWQLFTNWSQTKTPNLLIFPQAQK